MVELVKEKIGRSDCACSFPKYTAHIYPASIKGPAPAPGEKTLFSKVLELINPKKLHLCHFFPLPPSFPFLPIHITRV